MDARRSSGLKSTSDGEVVKGGRKAGDNNLRDYFKMARVLLLLQRVENRRVVRRKRDFRDRENPLDYLDDLYRLFHVSDTGIYCRRYIPPNSLLLRLFWSTEL